MYNGIDHTNTSAQTGHSTMFQAPIYHFRSPHEPPPSPRPPPLWLQEFMPAKPPDHNTLCNPATLQDHLKDTREMLDMLIAAKRELEAIFLLKSSGCFVAGVDKGSTLQLSEVIKRKKVTLDEQESFSLQAAKSMYIKIRDYLTPLKLITSQAGSWEDKSEAIGLAQKLQKHKRNKRWKKKKRRHVAEMLLKEHEMYDKIDQEADEWRTREIAKDIAKRKLELVLVVEKLQEFQAIRIRKLKKQGHFIPGEDDKFLERVQAAVEEEERQAAAAAETDAAKDAIANAEESRKAIYNTGNNYKDVKGNDEADTSHVHSIKTKNDGSSHEAEDRELEQKEFDRQCIRGTYEDLSNLPMEFYHYYHGSNYDMGTLIEVRWAWDAYIRPGVSRIPGHWAQPSPPSSETWASYLVTPRQ